MFPRLGRPTATATSPARPPSRADGGRISSEALRKIVAPVMRTADVPDKLCHRQTFAALDMQRRAARLEDLQQLIGHASIDTTSQYLHTAADELEADVDVDTGVRRSVRWSVIGAGAEPEPPDLHSSRTCASCARRTLRCLSEYGPAAAAEWWLGAERASRRQDHCA